MKWFKYFLIAIPARLVMMYAHDTEYETLGLIIGGTIVAFMLYLLYKDIKTAIQKKKQKGFKPIEEYTEAEWKQLNDVEREKIVTQDAMRKLEASKKA